MKYNFESDLIYINGFIQKIYQAILNQKIRESKSKNDDEIQRTKLEIVDWICDAYSKDADRIESLICIIALECYNYAYDDDDDEVVKLMKSCNNKEEFINEVWDNLDILYTLIEHEIYVYRPEGYSYRFANEVLKTQEGKQIYRKFHPNYQKEMEYNEFWQTHHNSKDFEIINVPIHNFLEYYLVMMYAIQIFEDLDETSLVVSDIWENMMKKDSKVAESILNEIIKYYYLYATKNYSEPKEQEIKIFLENKTRNDIIKDVKENDEMRFEMIQTFVNHYRIGMCPTSIDRNVKVFYKKMDNLSSKGE